MIQIQIPIIVQRFINTKCCTDADFCHDLQGRFGHNGTISVFPFMPVLSSQIVNVTRCCLSYKLLLIALQFYSNEDDPKNKKYPKMKTTKKMKTYLENS